MLVFVQCAVLALAVPLLTSGPESAILGLLTGGNDSPTTSHSSKPPRPSLVPSTTSARLYSRPFVTTSLEMVSSLENQRAFTSAATTSSPGTMATQTLPSSTSTSPPPSAGTASDHTSKMWQVIGIAIVAVLFVATSISCAMLFDRVWRFLKDVLCCTSTPQPCLSEELIPDCEKQAWDTRTLPRSPSIHRRESPYEDVPQARELPWDTDTQHWNNLRR